MSALCSSTAVLVTVHPQMLDVMSMCQFLFMTSELLSVVAEAGGDMSYDWLRYLITRYEPGDSPQNQMVSLGPVPQHATGNPDQKTAMSDPGMQWHGKTSSPNELSLQTKMVAVNSPKNLPQQTKWCPGVQHPVPQHATRCHWKTAMLDSWTGWKVPGTDCHKTFPNT